MLRSLVRARETALGHIATVSGFVHDAIARDTAPESVELTIPIVDRAHGTIPIPCLLANGGASKLVLIVHGMGGDAASPYAVRAARAAVDAGWAALRVHLRGASGDGADVYHAGLGDDVAQIVRAPALARYERIGLIGYSLGGHVTLRHAADGPHDPRLAGIAAVCPPIDLDRGSIAIQRFDRRPYQEYVLRSLRRQLAEVRARDPSLVPDVRPDALRTIRDWDEHVICPRFGFASLAAFYERETVGPRLAAIETRTLLVVADRDPMIALETCTPWIERASASVTVVRKRRGGHVAFPHDVGLTSARGDTMERELVRWLAST